METHQQEHVDSHQNQISVALAVEAVTYRYRRRFPPVWLFRDVALRQSAARSCNNWQAVTCWETATAACKLLRHSSAAALCSVRQVELNKAAKVTQT